MRLVIVELGESCRRGFDPTGGRSTSHVVVVTGLAREVGHALPSVHLLL